MNIVTVVGDPEKVCDFVGSLITAGNEITLLQKTRNNATYIIQYGTSGPVVTSYLLMEDGSFLLLESGDKIILE